VISAHTMSVRQDGAQVFVSAPVTIHSRATIGGEARISLGCVIGEDVIVEAGAVVAPFTRIPRGEVWGGNPARFQRTRDSEGCASPRTGELEGATADRAELRRLVIDALKLPPEIVNDELTSQNCLAWDSLGQLAIAAALHDRYGATIGPRDIFHLRSIDDIAEVIAGRRRSIADAAPNVEADETLDDDALLVLDRQEATRTLAARFQGQPPAGLRIRVVIAATFTAEPLATTIAIWGRAFGLELDCRFAGYDQVVQTLLDEAGPFAANREGINVVLARSEDFASSATGETRMDQVLDAVARFTSRQQAGAQLLVGTLPSVVSAATLANRNHIEALRHRWRTRLGTMPGVELFDFGQVVDRLGIQVARSSEAEVLTRAPYSPRLYQELGIELVRQIRVRHRSPAKVIALDCDDTLWGGIVGEVGLEGIVLGVDGPGRAFHLFQRYLKSLKERGLILAVVSRNEHRDVADVFENHPEMVLRPDDIVAWRVNWNHKSQNLRELADELNVGLDGIVLLDDDPATRAEVKARLPDVHVIPLPADPARYCEALERSWLFDGASPTSVDAARTRMMQEESRRRDDRSAAASLEDYLSGLELRVEIGLPSESEWPRVAQLTERTNQFNLSLKRRTVTELETLPAQMLVLVVRAKDRFGDYGLVGLAILNPVEQSHTWELDTLALSCRALGRAIEDAFLHGIAVTLMQREAKVLLAPYVTGPRNSQIKEFLARSGFEQTEREVWSLSVANSPPRPAHVKFDLLPDPKASDYEQV